MSIIKPTPGRIVWYHPAADNPHPGFKQGEAHAAVVAGVHDDRLVNLTVFDFTGAALKHENVKLIQEGDPQPAIGSEAYAVWMPYQKGQAAKTEALEQKFGS